MNATSPSTLHVCPRCLEPIYGKYELDTDGRPTHPKCLKPTGLKYVVRALSDDAVLYATDTSLSALRQMDDADRLCYVRKERMS